METCLESLWELLREPVSYIVENEKNGDLDNKQKVAQKSSEIIDAFFNTFVDCFGKDKGKEISKPEHITIFQAALKSFYEISIKGVKEGASSAEDESSKCGLCAVCRKCSENFYKDVACGHTEEKSLPYELENYFLMPSQMHYYEQRIQNAKGHFNLQDRLVCLKGFSSSTPTIHSVAFNSECVGGGLYINYKGLGIAIDPGIGFVNSMHKNGIYINDIDVVIITHDHLDHNADAKVISSLLYDLNNYNSRKNKMVKNIFELNEIKQHEITWIVDSETKKSLRSVASNIKNLSTFKGKKRQVVKGNVNIKLSAVQTIHMKNDKESFGIKLYMNFDEPFVIGYTSDTAYFSELAEFFKESNILIFNVSDIYKKDVKGIRYKHSHLGYNGSVKLLQETNSELAVASEFCCTNGDFRMGFIHTLSGEFSKSKTNIFPGEIGLNIHFPDMTVECSICKKLIDKENIKILAPQKEYGKIQYVCGHCAKSVL